MDVGLFEVPEKAVKIHETLSQYWRQLSNIRRKLGNSRIPGEKKSTLKRKEQEVQDRINDLNAKLIL